MAGLALADLSSTDPALVPYLIAALRTAEGSGKKGQAASLLVPFGPAAALAVPDLVAMLKQEEPWDVRRMAAIEVIAAIGPGAAAAVPALVSQLSESRYRESRTTTVKALGRIGPAAHAAEPRQLEILKADKAVSARVAAARALIEVAPDSARTRLGLAGALSDGDRDVQQVAAEFLAHAPAVAADAAAELRGHLTDDDAFVRLHAGLALTRIDPSDEAAWAVFLAALAEHAEALFSRDYDSFVAAAVAFQSVGRDAAPAEPRLRELLRNKKAAHRGRAVAVLATIEADRRSAAPPAD